jgi:acyl-CoA reductase-like NAD-dependent aldehyde dehydrogenase
MEPTAPSLMDEALEAVAAKKDEWAALPAKALLPLLVEMRRDVDRVAEEWVKACAAGKGVEDDPYGVGEEWVLFAAVGRTLRLLHESIRDIARGGTPGIPAPLWVNSRGNVVAEVFPASRLDKMSLPGLTAEVWMQAGDTIEDTVRAQAGAYPEDSRPGKVTLVLGAGNVSALVPADVLHKLFVERSVVVLKPNPVNDYLGPIIEKAFRVLTERGYLEVVYGGAEEGRYLSHHELVDEIHITGSDKTFEAVVFGSGAEGARRKQERTPLLGKRVTAELGNVSPVIVVPGPWSEEEIRAQGTKLAMWLAMNAGCNCLTPRVVIQHASWKHRDALNQAVRETLRQIPPRPAFYPGAEDRHVAFVRAHPKAWQEGEPGAGELPWTYITGVDSANTEDISFTTEPFAPVMSETTLGAAGVEEFLAQAVQFANEHLWGTLVAMLIVHPDSLADSAVSQAVEQAVSDLNYGTVTINAFPGMGWMLSTAPWGSAPGQGIYDIQSGTGVVNNLLMFAHPAKSIVRGPFIQSPDIFTPSFSKMQEFGRKLARFQARPSYWKLPGLIWTLLTG